jgi:hypothetical protein
MTDVRHRQRREKFWKFSHLQVSFVCQVRFALSVAHRRVPNAQTAGTDVLASSKPLDNFPFVRSRTIEEVRAALATIYTRPVLIPARDVEGFQATINICELHNVALAYGNFGIGLNFELPASGFFSLVLPVHGTGELVCDGATVAVTPGSGAVVSADSPHKAYYSADYGHFVLRIRARSLAEKLAALIGAPLNMPLRLGPPQNSTRSTAQMLQQYLPLLAGTLSEVSSSLPDWWVAQVEQLLMTLFLCGYQHNYTHLLERKPADAGLGMVRRAEEYIEANARRAITLEELADVTGVSAFSLFGAFKRHRGYSPFAFLAQVRKRSGGTLQ